MINRTTLMRNLKLKALLVVAFFGCQFLQAQYVTIPDSGFAAWLSGSYPGCMHNGQLDTNCAAVLNTHYLNTSYVRIGSLEGVQYFKNLDSLKCNWDTTLSYLPSLPHRLRTLECRYDSLTSLPTLPDTLTRLACEFNVLNYLPTLPATITSLTCYNNNLTKLPALPAGLNGLFCSGNQLDSLPALPDSLYVLSCYGNRIAQLPSLNNVLLYLLCSNNLLNTLPALPATLINLSCYSNNLMAIPALPPALQQLSCSHNKLASLPALPNTVATLNCAYNKLTSLPALPDSMLQLFINNNPNLQCLPQLNTIVDFEFNSTGVVCLPDFGNIYLANPDTLPLCDSTNNPHGCLQINGVKELVKPTFTLYPNPAKDYVMLAVDQSTLGGTVRVVDDNGRQVTTARITSGSLRINTSDLASGLYLILVNDPQGHTGVSKLVIGPAF